MSLHQLNTLTALTPADLIPHLISHFDLTLHKLTLIKLNPTKLSQLQAWSGQLFPFFRRETGMTFILGMGQDREGKFNGFLSIIPIILMIFGNFDIKNSEFPAFHLKICFPFQGKFISFPWKGRDVVFPSGWDRNGSGRSSLVDKDDKVDKDNADGVMTSKSLVLGLVVLKIERDEPSFAYAKKILSFLLI